VIEISTWRCDLLSSARLIDVGIAACLLIAALGPAASDQTFSTVNRGQFIVEEKCAGCHAMHGKVKETVAPSFMSIAARTNLTAERLRDLIVTPKHLMPATPLGSAELDAVVAYIRSLR
jgi:mono/diheme cytochrome c family protein